MVGFLTACRFNPTAGGTTDWTYSSAVTGYQSPTAATVVNGTTYRYRAESADLTQWEVGEGPYNTGTGVLSRTTVKFNSSGGTSKINFSTTPQVAVIVTADDFFQPTTLTNSLSGDVSLSNVSNYFDGPSVAQGTSGTWLASGTVTLLDTSGAASFTCKLWDGTTVIASARSLSATTGQGISVSLSGVLASPAGNIRISCSDPSSTSGLIKFNSSGNSKDSTITVVRIA